jgi:quinolinate synthase
VQDLLERIQTVRRNCGEELLILTHHYQRREIVAIGDRIGDSFVLAREAAASSARKIVFCGVHFMAESARILAKPEQQVFIPDSHAGCPMADMADADDARRALAEISDAVAPRKVVPVTYVNSNADVKAVVGAAGGIVCTSANADRAMRWARQKGDVIFFLPDEFLGTNTARSLGYRNLSRYNPHLPDGGLSDAHFKDVDVVVWQGYCHVHTYFTAAMVERVRQEHPQAQVYVHPECTPDLVAAADGTGSTGYLVTKVSQAAPGSTVVVGTEISLVKRLAVEYPQVRVIPLDFSLCPNMYRTTLSKVATLLETWDPAREIIVPEEIAVNARVALERMLAL